MNKSIGFGLRIIGLICLMHMAPYSYSAHNTNYGNEIYYTWIDSMRYEVTYVFYRSCSDSAFDISDVTVKVACLNAGNGVGTDLSLTRKSIEQLKTVCDSAADACGGKVNQPMSGSGIEKHVFLDTVDFSKSPFNVYGKTSCPKVRFEASVIGRSSSINTGISGAFYNYAMLDLVAAPHNSSPRYGFDPMPKICVNQPVYMSLGAFDTLDHDSLSYSLVKPLSSINQQMNYGTSLLNSPITVYYPVGQKFPFKNPNSDPPAGLNYDPVTGEFIFTPVKSGEHSVLAFEVKEWRKDSTGKAKEIGITRRDVQIVVGSCGLNRASQVKGGKQFAVCEEEELCVYINTEDKQAVPAPPLPRPDPDSTKIYWNHGIGMGATFEVLDDTVLNQTGVFCWTPPKGSSSETLYSFGVRVDDNNCNGHFMVHREFRIRVDEKPKAEISNTSLGCGRFALEALIDKTRNLPKSYWWEVLDYNTGQFDTSRKAPYFTLSKHPISGGRTDTLNIRRNGKYIIHLLITNDQNCDREYWDTIDVQSVLRVDMASQKDSFHCRGEALVLRPKVTGNAATVKFNWSNGSSADTLLVQLHDTVLWEGLHLTVTDTGGCTAWDSIDVLNRPNPTIDPITDKVSCPDDSVLFTAYGHLAPWNDPRIFGSPAVSQGSVLRYEWYFDTSLVGTDTQHMAQHVGLYQVFAIDSLNCKADTTVRFIGTSVVVPLDKNTCIDAGTLDLRKEEFSGQSGGDWYCPKYPSIIRDKRYFETDSVLDLGSFTYELYYDYIYKPTGCTLTDSFTLRVNLLPNVKLRDGYFCQDKNVVDLANDDIIQLPGQLALGKQVWKCVDCGSYDESEIIEDIGPKGQQRFVANIDEKTIALGAKTLDSITLEMTFTDAYGCSNSDTTTLSITRVPKITFADLGGFCWDVGEVDLKTTSGVQPKNGYWKAIDSAGYAPAKDLNQALKSDTSSYDSLLTWNTPQPVEGTSNTYILRYHHDASGCPTTRDTTLTIHSLPMPIIDLSSMLGSRTTNEPYTYCEFDPTVTLTTNYSGGIWTAGQSSTISGREFSPSAVSVYDQPFYIYYDYTDLHGCKGKDSAQVEIHEEHKLFVANDTSVTGFANPTVIELSADYKNAAGIQWLPLIGGTIDKPESDVVNFSMPALTDTVRRFMINISTRHSLNNVCPFVQDNIQVWLHPSPCVEIVIDYDQANNKVNLSPSNENLQAYEWTLASLSSSDAKPSFDVSGINMELVTIWLRATNELGDTCRIEKVLNLKTGNVRDLQKVVSYYPNPVIEGFTLEFDGELDWQGARLRIYNQQGATVRDQLLESDYVDCKDFATGVYNFDLVIDGRRYVGRFMKQ